MTRFMSIWYRPSQGVACVFFKANTKELTAVGSWQSNVNSGDVDWQKIVDKTIEIHGIDQLLINGLKFIDLNEHPIYTDIQNFEKRNIILCNPLDRIQGLIAYNAAQDRLRFSSRFGQTAKLREILNRDQDFTATSNLVVMAFLQGLKFEPQPKPQAFLGGIVRGNNGGHHLYIC